MQTDARPIAHDFARRTAYLCAPPPETIMSHPQTQRSPSDRFELRFHSLHKPGRGYSFPCEAGGLVDMDALSEGERHRYLYARAIVGRELSLPAVQRCDR
jgi:hypothetical protein